MQEEKEKSYSLNGFTREEARKIIQHRLDISAGRQPNRKPSETTSVWFSAKQFLEFAEKLKNDMIESADGSDKLSPSGVRIYFANYGEDGTKEESYKHRDTLVFVSTCKYEKRDSAGKIVHRDYYSPIKGDNKTEPMNKGKLCPPEVCDCARLLSEGILCEEAEEHELI